jgi:hypothetical protein
MRVQHVIGLAAAITLGGGCLQAIGFKEATLDPSCCAGGGGSGGSRVAGSSTATGGGEGGGATGCDPGTTRSCYSGDVATENVGACKAGTQTCSQSGQEYAACVGEVLPAKEDCSKPEDEDCDGFACSQTIWAKQFGETSFQEARTVAVDKKTGDVFIGGEFTGAIQFGNDVLIDAGAGDAFIAKFDTDGNYLWSKQFGDKQTEIILAMVVDADGNVIVVGQGDLGGGNVKKLNATGGTVWTAGCVMTVGLGAIHGITVDPQGDVIVAGDLSGTGNCNGASLNSSGGVDVLVAKLAAADGMVKWTKTFGDAADQSAKAVGSDSTGNIYVTGQFSGDLKFGPTTSLTAAGGGDVYVAKLSSTGAGTWATRLGDKSGQSAYALAVDKFGASVVSGYYQGTIALAGAGVITNSSMVDYNGFMAKIDTSGVGIWLNDMPKSVLLAVATDSARDVLVTMSNAQAAVGSKFGVSKLAGGTGLPLWTRDFGTANGNGIASGKLDEVFFGGSFKGTLAFDPFTLNTTGGPANSDIFLAKIAP